MSNTTNDSTIQTYNKITQQFTRYVGILLYIICSSGTLLNILTFLQQMYNRRACSFYLLIASTCDLIHLNLEPLANILQYGFNFDWTVNNLIYCKTKSYFAYVSTITSGTLTTSASIVQYLLSSEKSSRWYYARFPMSVRCTKFVILFWTITSIPIILCSKRFSHTFENHRFICSNPARHISCYLIQAIYICLLNGFLPPFVMMIFGYLTHRNVIRRHRRSRHRSIRIRQINQQLTSMLILQSIKSAIASIPFSIFNCYWLLTMKNNKSLILQARENLIHQILYLLFWSNYTSFFVYAYSSDIFRNQWMTAMKKFICCLYGTRGTSQGNGKCVNQL